MPTHAILDSFSREKKARKIERLAKRFSDLKFQRMLEVGCGSGFIAAYFSMLGYNREGTYAVDIADECQTSEGFQFQRVHGTALPFADSTFDFVISNHVVEHVGSRENQAHHLHEIYRVLEPDGTLYVAVPNRWRLIEPHYNIPFLSWLPERNASTILRSLKRRSHYDCKPLSRKEVTRLFHQIGFEYIDATLDAISLLGEIEGNWSARFFSALPRSFFRIFSIIIPSLIFVCRKPAA